MKHYEVYELGSDSPPTKFSVLTTKEEEESNQPHKTKLINRFCEIRLQLQDIYRELRDELSVSAAFVGDKCLFNDIYELMEKLK